MLARLAQNVMEQDISTPLIAQAWVTDYDSQYYRLKVLLSDGSPCPYPVQIIVNGPADPFGINQVEMPRRGTKGIVVFPNRDMRSGVWLGSFNSNLNNAVNSPAQTPFENYFSHWNGAFEHMDQTGNSTKYFTDGTYIKIAQSTALPTLYHNVYNGSGAGVGSDTRQTFPISARIPNPPSPFYVYLYHATGTAFQVDPTGNISVTGVGTVTVSASGSMVFKTANNYGVTATNAISVSAGTTLGVSSVGDMTLNTAAAFAVSAVGNVSVLASGNISASAANGHTVTVQANSTTFQIDASGNILMTLAGGATFQVNGAGDSLALVSALVTWLSTHTHAVTATGGAPTSVPIQPIASSTIQSSLVKVAS